MGNGVPDYDLFDFFSFIVPGSIVILLVYPFVPKRVIDDIVNMNQVVLLTYVLLIGYLLGQISFRIVNKYFPIKNPYFKIESKRPKNKRPHIQNKFFSYAPGYFGLKKEETGNELYHTTKSHLYSEKKGSGRVQKFHTLHDLFHSASLIFGIFCILYVANGLYSGNPLYLLSGLGLLLLSLISWDASKYYYYSHVVVLINEFFTNFLNEKSDDGHNSLGDDK
ncbi:hypothetical protein [Haladaptatus sp. NG-WS-4]